MNALNMAKTAYATTAAPIRTMRGVEYDAFSRITHRLKAADEKGNFNALVNALHENGKLWTILAVDIVDDANQLPEELRARIFYLSEFTKHHTRLVIRREANAKPLIDINTAIMRGLRSKAGSA